jgi:Flp pilus assembly protein TadG
MSHKPKAQKGVAIVEFALVLPILLLLTLMTTELGRAIYQYNILTKSVRDGARYLSTQSPGSAAAITTARKLMVFGNPAATDSDPPLAIGLSLTNVPVPSGGDDDCCKWQEVTTTPVNGSSKVINTVTVRISGYSFNSMFASAFGVTFGTFAFPDITATMRTALVGGSGP